MAAHWSHYGRVGSRAQAGDPYQSSEVGGTSPSKPACLHALGQEQACRVSLRTVLPPGFTPNEEELIVLIAVHVTPTPCSPGKPADALDISVLSHHLSTTSL